MTMIALRKQTIDAYMGSNNFRGCQDISSIHVEYEEDTSGRMVANVAARIPASTTNQRNYEISVHLHPQGTSIYRSFCTCPIMNKCKHIHKVLHRIRQSREIPIPAPSRQHLERVARRQRLAEQMQHASVFVAFACKSELDSGSDYRRSMFVRDKYDQKVLGVFFSMAQANRRAKEYVQDELGHELDDEDDEDEWDFDWDDEELGPDEDNEHNKVWVEQFAIEDASRNFHT